MSNHTLSPSRCSPRRRVQPEVDVARNGAEAGLRPVVDASPRSAHSYSPRLPSPRFGSSGRLFSPGNSGRLRLLSSGDSASLVECLKKELAAIRDGQIMPHGDWRLWASPGLDWLSPAAFLRVRAVLAFIMCAATAENLYQQEHRYIELGLSQSLWLIWATHWEALFVCAYLCLAAFTTWRVQQPDGGKQASDEVPLFVVALFGCHAVALPGAVLIAAGFWWRQAVSRMGSFRYPVHFYLVENCEILLNHGGNLALLLIDFALGSQPVVLSQAIVLSTIVLTYMLFTFFYFETGGMNPNIPNAPYVYAQLNWGVGWLPGKLLLTFGASAAASLALSLIHRSAAHYLRRGIRSKK